MRIEDSHNCLALCVLVESFLLTPLLDAGRLETFNRSLPHAEKATRIGWCRGERVGRSGVGHIRIRPGNLSSGLQKTAGPTELKLAAANRSDVDVSNARTRSIGWRRERGTVELLNLGGGQRGGENADFI